MVFLYRMQRSCVHQGADVFRVSDEDLRRLGFTSEPKIAARELLAIGARLVVVTLGASGAWVLSRNHELLQPADYVVVVDTVGAGDCFFAGFIASLARDGAIESLLTDVPIEDLLERALTHATRCAAINISRRGCQPPTWDEVVLRLQPGLLRVQIILPLESFEVEYFRLGVRHIAPEGVHGLCDRAGRRLQKHGDPCCT